MSTNKEKIRAIRQLPNVIRALLQSKKNRITRAWKHELYYALKHYPWQTDEITVNKYKEDQLNCRTLEEIDEVIKWLREWVDSQTTKPKTKKKRK